jgi:hypothetical protein
MLKELNNKIAVKQALAEKYNHLAMLAGSSVKRSTYLWHAARFRAQLSDLKHKLAQKEAERAANAS